MNSRLSPGPRIGTMGLGKHTLPNPIIAEVIMNRTCHIASGRGRSVQIPTFKAKEILRRVEGRLIALTDRLFAALDRDRERLALGRLDARAMKDIGRAPHDRDERP